MNDEIETIATPIYAAPVAAKPQPSGDAADERAAFEAWYQHHHGDRDVYVLDKSGEYANKHVQGAFNVWQARAALATQLQQKPVGVLECVAMGEPYFHVYRHAYSLPFGKHYLYTAHKDKT